jgi:dihydroflavonol-4-reductase
MTPSRPVGPWTAGPRRDTHPRMKILVTGATGLVGHAIAKKLAAKGETVTALVRDPDAAARKLSGVSLVRGDIVHPASLAPAMRDVELVFHAAGMPEQWQPDEGIFDRVNRGGTANVLEAALAAGVRRVVYTSTMDVFAAETGGTLVETNLDPEPKHTAYERSKQAADREAERVRAKGLEVVHVNPSAVYGPSPVPQVALNGFFVRLLNRQIPMLPPGGMSVVYVDGVAEAHLAAADRGKSGERYLVSDGFVTNAELAQVIAEAGGLRKVPRTAPVWLLQLVARASAPLARAFHFRPLVAPGELTFLLWSARVNAEKAKVELGFVPTPLDEGVRRTVEFLRGEGLLRRG